MIRITQLKLPVSHRGEDLEKKAAKILRVGTDAIKSLKIVKQSIDARNKEEIWYIYTVDVEVLGETQAVKKAKSSQVAIAHEKKYRFPPAGSGSLSHPPVIIGCGPAGLFCGLMLAQAGYRPLILERGKDVDSRRERVERFWRDGTLDPETNVQFGEGGAGTFSDGKLNTLVKDPGGRNQKVLEILAEYGADPEILYVHKPHVGTDVLGEVVKNMRRQIIRLGGQVRFDSQVTDLIAEDGQMAAVEVNGQEIVPASQVVLAVGHSARDTFSMLYQKGVPMAQKAFAVGLRIQHPQKMLNDSQYGEKWSGFLGPAPYKVTWQSGGRGVYSFCMCPGGYVVDASSEPGMLAVNGMSNHDRGGRNGNSALIVTVGPEDFGDASPLAGVEFQRKLEGLAYRCGGGKIPVQLYGDFKQGIASKDIGDVKPQIKGRYQLGNLRQVLPECLSLPLIEGVEQFEHRIKGFSRYDSILAGVESRTSSPVRIHRDEKLESRIGGLYPCGEGAGYAGGITSAAMDGIRVAEMIGQRFAPMKDI